MSKTHEHVRANTRKQARYLIFLSEQNTCSRTKSVFQQGHATSFFSLRRVRRAKHTNTRENLFPRGHATSLFFLRETHVHARKANSNRDTRRSLLSLVIVKRAKQTHEHVRKFIPAGHATQTIFAPARAVAYQRKLRDY